MADYISRDDFAGHLADIQYGEAPTGRTGENIDYQNGVYAGLDMAYVALKQFPAADVRPVVQGAWERPKGSTPRSWIFVCSKCGDRAYFPVPKYFPKGCGYNFCPNCGADMREVKADG